MQEVMARGGKILFITDNYKELVNENIRFGLRVPRLDKLLSPILLTIPLQLLSYCPICFQQTRNHTRATAQLA